MEIKIKQSKLNEAIIGNCNMEVPEGTVETKGNVPEVYADAINQRRDREKKITDAFKEQDKTIEEFAKESQDTENKPKGTPEMKKLHLSESLFEEALDNKDLNKRASDIVASIKEFIEKVKQPNISYEEIDNYDIKDMQKVADKLDKFSKISSHKEGSMDESFTPDAKLYKQAQDVADYLEEFMNSGITSNYAYFDDADREAIEQTFDTLSDFAQRYSTIMDDENVFEAVETPVDTKIYYKKKRGPLVAIIEDELGSGEVVYKLGKSGKYNPTHAPSLNIDRYLIGGGTDEKGEYISAWIPENKIDDAVAIAKKYNKEYKLGHDKYVRGDKDFIRIYIDEADWEGNYVDPNVPTLNRKG